MLFPWLLTRLIYLMTKKGIYVKGREYKQWELSGKAGEEPLPNWGKEAFFGKDLLKSLF